MRKILFILINAFILTSCGNNQQQAISYNNSLIKIQHEVATETPKFNQLLQTADSATAYKLLTDLSTYIGTEQKKAEALQFDGDDLGMKATLLEGFGFFKKVLSDDFVKILRLRFAKSITPTDQQQMQQIVENIRKQGQEVDKKFLDAQQEFAKKHNIKLLPQ